MQHQIECQPLSLQGLRTYCVWTISFCIAWILTIDSEPNLTGAICGRSFFSTFPILQAAYQLKELYRKFNQIPDCEEACRLFPKIKKYFSDSNIPQYDEFSGLLERWQTEILNSFLRPYEDNRRLSNAYTENLNGKIRTYIDVSRGIKNFDRFRKRVIYALNPEISYALTMNLHSEKYKGKTRGSYLKPID